MLVQVNPLGFSKAKLGGHSARSMMFLEMRILIRAMPPSATLDDFTRAIVEENVLEKPTLSSRKKSLRHLMELYGMDPSKALFRFLWELGHADLDSLPQLCLVCAYARDPQLRHSFELIRSLRIGEVLERAAMEEHLENGFSGRFSPAMKKSMAQNVNTTWTFGGHLAGKVKKARRLPEPRPISAAYAMKEIIGCAFEVSNELGAGFLESVYEKAMVIALEQKGLLTQPQHPIKVLFRQKSVGDFYADIFVEGKVIVELKAVKSIAPEHQAQIINYLNATGIEVGLLINFGNPKLEYRRFTRRQ